MTACVIGKHLRETSIAGTVIQQADETGSGDFPEAKVVDNLYQIRFTPNGTFLPQSEGDAFAFPGHVGDRPGIEVDPMTLDNDDPIGSRSRDIARGIFALLPPRAVKLGEHSILPKIKIAGTGVSFKPFLSAVSCILVDIGHHQLILFRCFQLVHHFPVKATIEIADKRLLSLSQTIDDIKWTATQLQARYDDLDVPHEGYNQILDVRAMGASDSDTECSWFGTLFDRHRGIGGTLSNGDVVPPGIGYRQLHYFDTDREQGMIRNDWVYPAGQTGKVVLIEEIRETRTPG
jgi:hypothetical protein